MLTLTENASAVIKNITESQQQPDGAGLRIVQQGDGQEAELALTTATEPESGDQVVEEQGARVFLEETAAQTLEDKVLDAQVDESGGVQFTLAIQPDATG
ncbi:MAG: Fe-S cluster assembly protein HesB [Actinomycetota bacterium]|nr:Fe-S cluster assembly protein HesB [Actinomycetota bacterium]